MKTKILSKKALVKELLENTDDSFDLIAHQANCEVSYVKQIAKELDY